MSTAAKTYEPKCYAHPKAAIRQELLSQIKGIEGPKSHTPEWYALRLYDPERKDRPVVFGATEAAGAMSLSPYASNTPLGLFCKKRGLDREMPDSKVLRRGRRFERPVLEEYAVDIEAPVVVGLPTYLHPVLPFMACTPDGLSLAQGAGRANVRGVDAKCSTFRRYDAFGLDETKFGQEGTDQLPIDYVLQGQQTMEVLGLDEIDFVVLFDIHNIKVYRVERNPELIAGIVKAEQELAERIINDDPPPPNWELEDSAKYIGIVNAMQPGKVIDLPEEVDTPDGKIYPVKDWERLSEIKEEIKHLEAEKSKFSMQVMWALGGANVARLPGGEREINRIIQKETYVTPEDVKALEAKVGQVKRAGYEYLRERKAKS